MEPSMDSVLPQFYFQGRVQDLSLNNAHLRNNYSGLLFTSFAYKFQLLYMHFLAKLRIFLFSVTGEKTKYSE